MVEYVCVLTATETNSECVIRLNVYTNATHVIELKSDLRLLSLFFDHPHIYFVSILFSAEDLSPFYPYRMQQNISGYSIYSLKNYFNEKFFSNHF